MYTSFNLKGLSVSPIFSVTINSQKTYLFQCHQSLKKWLSFVYNIPASAQKLPFGLGVDGRVDGFGL